MGCGAVGARAARQLTASDDVERVTCVDRTDAVVDRLVSALGPRAIAHRGPADDVDAETVILATGGESHADLAARLLSGGRHVVSVSDHLEEVQRLMALDATAQRVGRTLVLGAGMAPGLTCLLARHMAPQLATVEEIHVAKFGTGGPACARQHHVALRGQSLEWREGQWRERPAGTGRELCWFPDPVGAHDCYGAELADPLLLHAAFPGVQRISARLSATRRDRLTARLPMLRKPHPEGLLGAVRIELRGTDTDGARLDIVLGAMDRPAVAAGAVAAVAAMRVGRGLLVTPGMIGLADPTVDATAMLAELARRGVKAAVFQGDLARSGPTP